MDGGCPHLLILLKVLLALSASLNLCVIQNIYVVNIYDNIICEECHLFSIYIRGYA